MNSFLSSTCLAAATIGLAAGCASKQTVQVPAANPVTTVVGAGAPAPKSVETSPAPRSTAAPAVGPSASPATVAATASSTPRPAVSTTVSTPPSTTLSNPLSTPLSSGNYQPEAGLYRCEEKQTVAVKRVMDDGKRVVINWKAKDYNLVLIPTDSGAIRYEDKAAGFAWIYVVGKAFLLDSKRGSRIANDCKI